jgi:hypothetical protein
MRKQGRGALLISTCLFVSSGAAYAGTKHIHNMDVKAQCIAKADADNLTGHERHVTIKQCRQDGSFFFHHA